MNYTVGTYVAYLTISLFMTVWVARTLSRNGLVFLVDAFGGNKELANSVNHLLVVGFYLINIGYVSLALKTAQRPTDVQQAIELLSYKVGVVLVVLGAMHFFNIYVFHKLRNRGMVRHQPPPVAPRQYITPPTQQTA
jgi:hypothetical protein